MFKNHLIVALRTLRAHKVFSAINILGLAVSMSVCLLVLLFVFDQINYDRFHRRADDIFQVYSIFKPAHRSESRPFATAPAELEALVAGWADIEATVRMVGFFATVSYEGQKLKLSGLHVDPTFFDVFDFAFSAGITT